MKKRSILILLTLTLSIYASNINVQITAEENDYTPTLLELTPHDPIEITSDSDFEVFLGTGTAEDPYVIEGYNITTTSERGIYITDTTKYFTVRNCYVDAEDYGIYIDDVADGTVTVINNTCNNNHIGIYLWSSGSSIVANNTCNDNFEGILLEYSGSSIVANNTCNDNFEGISLSNSGSSIVANNTCNDNFEGILLEYSGSSIVANNTCNDNWSGIMLLISGSSTVVNNTFTNCGLDILEGTIDAHLSYTVRNNWVNGKILGFYTNLDSTIIAESVYGQLILVNCTNVTVRDQILNNATIGLSLYYCTYSTIINNTCNNNNWNGIYLHSSDSLTVINNTCNNNNWHGIYLYDSGSSTVANNTCNNNWCGIMLLDSGSSTVANNACSNNNMGGIYLDSSGSSTVINNTCSKNYYGIYLYSSSSCVITYNLLQENEKYGIYLYNSVNRLIHHNNFVDNNLGGTSQAFDDGANNYWYDTATKEGNYWSDWSGAGSYSIDGSASSEDLYPLDEPAEYTTTEHTTTEHTTTEHTTIESTTDENPLNFTFALLMLVVPLILTRTISKKAKEK